MKLFEILSGTADIRVRAEGSTRPAFLVAALQGMSAVSGPEFAGEEAEHVTRPFKLATADFPSLLVGLLNQAIASSRGHHEAYDDIAFTLVTDTKAEGAFIGKPVVGFGTRLEAAMDLDVAVQKNDIGNWEATIAFTRAVS